MRLVFPTRIRTALFAGLLLGGLAVAVAQQPSDQSAPPQSAPQTDQQTAHKRISKLHRRRISSLLHKMLRPLTILPLTIRS